jgi:hypothetical protein
MTDRKGRDVSTEHQGTEKKEEEGEDEKPDSDLRERRLRLKNGGL